MEKTAKLSQSLYPPVVSVLGHVDHGKTSLLDKIRTSDIAAGERGGITQKIGASSIEIDHEGKKRLITFVDTPGHEAFANMRSQGVSAADIVLLIVAADDGVMPQTRESIEKIREAKIPFIVVFTKIDMEGAVIERAKQSVLKEGVLLEGLGGDVPYIEVSSKTGQNIQELLDLIVLVYDMSAQEKDGTKPFLGVVIESLLDKRRGVVASVVVKQGTLNTGEKLFRFAEEVGKARALFDTHLTSVKTAEPGQAVEIIGLTKTLPAGSLVFTTAQAQEDIVKEVLKKSGSTSDMTAFFNEKPSSVSVILKTQTAGELEAIKESLPDDITVLSEGQGEIAVSDVMMAKDFKGIVLGFNVSIAKEAKQMADNEHVFYRIYSIIYELLDEISDAVAMVQEEGREKILGKASIIASFQGTEGEILGVRVNEGRLLLNDTVRVEREGTVTGEAKIATLKRMKEDVKEVGKGQECGVALTTPVDFRPGDMLISYR
ncbi:MAG TPA: GTP-binding protein [Candidatus Levybacteria bacterium]|nr:GTP-binding protein [Candidatus Levybacteria bacterium]